MAEDQNIIVVDMFDRKISNMKKLLAHKRPILHRAFSIFICDDEHMLLQRRHPEKYHSGGLWANTCCSHPHAGESTWHAASRRLKEEMGISCELSELGSFVYYHKFENGLYEFEYDHVFWGAYSGQITPDPLEIAETKWIAFSDLAKQMETKPDTFVPWFFPAISIVFQHLENTNLDCVGLT